MFKRLLLPLLFNTAFLNAADITGQWLYTQHLPDGRTRETALFLKPGAPFGYMIVTDHARPQRDHARHAFPARLQRCSRPHASA